MSLFAQFMWDYYSFTNSATYLDCKSYYISSSLGTLLLVIALKLLVYFLHPWGIYYIQYWRNRKQLQMIQQIEEKNLQMLLTDNRSDLFEEPDSFIK